MLLIEITNIPYFHIKLFNFKSIEKYKNKTKYKKITVYLKLKIKAVKLKT